MNEKRKRKRAWLVLGFGTRLERKGKDLQVRCRGKFITEMWDSIVRDRVIWESPEWTGPWAWWGREERGERRTKCGSQPGGQRYQEGGKPKWLEYIGKGSWGKDSPASVLENFRVGGGVCQPGGPCGYWGLQGEPSGWVGFDKLGTSALCSRFET